MLVLCRKMGESICIGDEIKLTVSAIAGNRVKICIDAPRECAIRREEIAVEQRRPHQGGQLPSGAIAQ